MSCEGQRSCSGLPPCLDPGRPDGSEPVAGRRLPFVFANHAEELKRLMAEVAASATEDSPAAVHLRDTMLDALKSDEVSRGILLAWRIRPQFCLYPKVDGKIGMALVWRNMARVAPTGGVVRTEQRYLELPGYSPGLKPMEAPAKSEGGGGSPP